MAESSKVISFRVDGASLERLQEEARAEGVGLNELAKKRFTETRSADTLHILKMETAALRSEVQALRGDVAASVEMLLVQAGQFSCEQARGFVNRTLRKA